MPRTISPAALARLIGSPDCPVVVDVRREQVFQQAGSRIPTALWRPHTEPATWLGAFGPGRSFVVYCVHGHNVSEIAAARMRAFGADVAILEGGIEAYAALGEPMVIDAPGVPKKLAAPSVWVTRERPKIDRVACPWLIRRFVDPFAVFHYVASEWVRGVAEEIGAIPFDVDGVAYSHRGDQCSFDTMLDEFGLDSPALRRMARIVRGADTARLDLEPQAAGLLAILLGLSAMETDDLRQLDKAIPVFDALYAWLRYAAEETHNWPARAGLT
ncbi:MAG: chromate resistance protein [Mesorhizobium sp.]|nr:chromate resistance protein ChrB domain-containing protein [Mesorhizobium sp.]MCO5162899.1 chromate resistance protein [Mesorhizobium sp.]